MTAGSREHIKTIFEGARQLHGADRAAFLDRECGADQRLLAQVEDLLAALDEAEHFMSAPTSFLTHRSTVEVHTPPSRTTLDAEQPGSMIGSYKLLQQIGEGGFGVVFLAEQAAPLVRRVALKVIKRGMDTRQVVARFEQERQALAIMDHPNIARVLDAGATQTGRPYFVMELVRGDPITAYCDTHNLSTAQRLELFSQVCNAVQHAHQKGIIHRDLKPSNVLVTIFDGRPVPKVIDFGIAKATAARPTEKTLFTEHRTLIGTPEYMSPEQAEMSGVDIDTRSDIYSLGVLLYELLTGTTPFDPRSLRSAALGEMQRIIREQEPPRPSTRLSALKDTMAGVAARRHTEPAKLAAMLRGDLDWIVMRCLEKDRTRRYDSASGLAMDVQRHLTGEPVHAAPPSGVYRMRKFVRKHRAGVAVGSVIAAALLMGAVGTSLGLVWALRERANARASETLAVQREAQTAKVAKFQSSMLAGLDAEKMSDTLRHELRRQVSEGLARRWVPGSDGQMRQRTDAEVDEALGQLNEALSAGNPTDVSRQVLYASLLGPALDAIGRDFADQPLVAAQLRLDIARVLTAVGMFDRARTVLQSALETRRTHLGAVHVAVMECVEALYGNAIEAEQMDEAEALAREFLSLARQLFPTDHADLARAIAAVTKVLRETERFTEAEPLDRESLAMIRRLGSPGVDADEFERQIAITRLRSEGKIEETVPLLRESVEARRRALGEGDWTVATSKVWLADALSRVGKVSEAEALVREALASQRKQVGDENVGVFGSLMLHAGLLHQLGRSPEAVAAAREALDIERRVRGPVTQNGANALWNLAQYEHDAGRFTEAVAILRESLAVYRALAGDHTDAAGVLHHLADSLRAAGQIDEAVAYAQQSLDLYRRIKETGSYEFRHALRVQAEVSLAAKRWSEAAVAMAESLPLDRAAGDLSAELITRNLTNLGEARLRLGKFADAEEPLRECLAIRRERNPDGHPHAWLRFDAMRMLGWCLLEQRKFAEAETMLLEAHSGLPAPGIAAKPQPDAGGFDRRRDTASLLARLYSAWHEAEPSAGHDAQAASWRSQTDATPQNAPG